MYGSHSQVILNRIIDHSSFMLPNFMESVNCNSSKDFNFLASCGDRGTGRKRLYSSLVLFVRNIPCFLFCSSEEAAHIVSCYIEVHALTSCMLALHYSQWLPQLLSPWYVCNVEL